MRIRIIPAILVILTIVFSLGCSLKYGDNSLSVLAVQTRKDEIGVRNTTLVGVSIELASESSPLPSIRMGYVSTSEVKSPAFSKDKTTACVTVRSSTRTRAEGEAVAEQVTKIEPSKMKQ